MRNFHEDPFFALRPRFYLSTAFGAGIIRTLLALHAAGILLNAFAITEDIGRWSSLLYCVVGTAGLTKLAILNWQTRNLHCANCGYRQLDCYNQECLANTGEEGR